MYVEIYLNFKFKKKKHNLFDLRREVEELRVTITRMNKNQMNKIEVLKVKKSNIGLCVNTSPLALFQLGQLATSTNIIYQI